MMHRPEVLFVCVSNRGKSQMAVALTRLRAGERVMASSAGTDPAEPGAGVNTESLEALAEIGATMSAGFPKSIDPDIVRRVDRVVVLGSRASQDVTPVEGMRGQIETWELDEPADRGIEGVERMRLIRDQMDAKVQELLTDLDGSTRGGDGKAFNLVGRSGNLAALTWSAQQPSYLAVLVHGYGEHIGRYGAVAARLVDDGAAVYGLDHRGHGYSDGERVLIEDLDEVVDDLEVLVDHARDNHPSLRLVLVGHSMGGLIASRFAQRHPDAPTALVLSSPMLGRWTAVEQLLEADEIPDAPIDPTSLSRDKSVGMDYTSDTLVWHGPFKRQTVRALSAGMDTVAEAGRLQVPTLWLHGEADELVPMSGTRVGWEAVRGEVAQQKSYPGARHEIFNETNKQRVLDDVLAFVHERLPTAH